MRAWLVAAALVAACRTPRRVSDVPARPPCDPPPLDCVALSREEPAAVKLNPESRDAVLSAQTAGCVEILLEVQSGALEPALEPAHFHPRSIIGNVERGYTLMTGSLPAVCIGALVRLPAVVHVEGGVGFPRWR